MKKTNKQLIKKLLGDTIDEAFVICAVERYSNQILSDSIEPNERSLINQDLWQVVAKHHLETIKEHYE